MSTRVKQASRNLSTTKPAIQVVRRPASKQADPKILTRLEQLKVLSSLERAGLLSKLESSGLTLRFIEENKLLSKADDLGVLPALSDRSTPGKLLGLGLVLVFAAAAAVVVIPDNTSNDVITQAALAGGLGIAGTVALVAGGFVSDLQR